MYPVQQQFTNRQLSAATCSKRLSREEETVLATAWRTKQDTAARDRLARAHLGYVVATANKYRRYGVPVSELIAEGNVGLVHALRKFEPERGHRFVTYAAYWVRAYILNHVIRSWSLVGSGSGALRSRLFFRLRREKAQLATCLGDAAAAEEQLAKKLNLAPDKLSAMLRQLEVRDVSLDQTLFDGASTTRLDALVSGEPSQEQLLERGRMQDALEGAVRQALVQLDVRERFIAERRMMAEAEDRLSLAEIGRTLGVSRERARQLETRAKGKLRSALARLPEAAQPDWFARYRASEAA